YLKGGCCISRPAFQCRETRATSAERETGGKRTRGQEPESDFDEVGRRPLDLNLPEPKRGSMKCSGNVWETFPSRKSPGCENEIVVHRFAGWGSRHERRIGSHDGSAARTGGTERI